MKKIIYLADARIPTEKAHGIQIMKMCEAFSLRDTNILMHPVKSPQSGELAESELFNRVNTNDTNRVELELIIPKRINCIKNNPFDYYNIRKIFKIKKIFSFDLTFFWPILGSFAFLWQSFWFGIFSSFYAIFHQADIIYFRDFLPLFFLSFFKKNLVYEMHTFPDHPFFYKRIFAKTKKIIVITHKIKELLVKEGIEENKILVASDGVDLKDFEIKESQEECRKKLNLPLDKKIVLYTGHLFKWKGAHILAEAAEYLKDYLLIFVGGAEKDVKIFNFQFSIFKNILVIGHRPHSEIPYWLKAADVLVLPNSAQEKISQFYTSPLKMFEYMTSKKPIVAANLPSISEILNENNAILVEPDNFNALAQGIEKALKNMELSDKICQRAYLDVQNYTWKKRVQSILEFVL